MHEPINLGSSQLVTINELVDIVEGIAGVKLERNYKLDAPQGVRGRNSDNTLILEQLGWEPSTTLEAGLATTYEWIYAPDDERRAATRRRSRSRARDHIGFRRERFRLD